MVLRDALRRWRGDRMAFRREAIILEDGRAFGEVMEAWQRDDFAEIDAHQHAYLERPRGHSKTGDIATEAVTELVLGPPNQRLFCAAADEDQARLLFDDVATKFERNPILRNSVQVKKREIVVSTGSTLRLLNSDAPSAYGLRPDWIAIDELAEWVKRDLWDSLWSATGKRPRCRVLVITTAGWDKTSIAWEVREIARTESDWYFAARGPCAAWISKEWREQQRRTLPPHVFARLHEARWVDNVGAFLTSDEVDAVFIGVPAVAGGQVAMGLDIGLTRDRTVCAVCRNVNGLIIVDHLVTWTGRPGLKVDLAAVEAEVKVLADRCHAPVCFDPYQGVHLAQRLQRQGVHMVEFPFTADSRRKLFSTLLDLVRTRRLRSQPHEEFRRELFSLEVTETAAGWRVDHRAGRFDDHVIAVALASQAVASQPVAIDLTTQAYVPGEAERLAATNTHMREIGIASGTPSPWDGDGYTPSPWSNGGGSPWDL